MKRTSWILIILLILTLAAYFLINFLPEKTISDNQEEDIVPQYLVSETQGSLRLIRIIRFRDDVVVMEKNTENIWEIIFPSYGIADQAKLSEVETQINALKIVTAIGEVITKIDYGLLSPDSIIKLEYISGKSHLLTIGNSSPTGSGYYVQLDNKQVFIISKYSLDAILGLANTPPLPPTATPTSTMDLSIITPSLGVASPTIVQTTSIP